jgi:ribosome-binding protein aMBF1 (putative translation factor)
MGTKFSEFMKELEEEIRREGPEAVAEAAALDARFKLAAELISLRQKRGLTQRQLAGRSGIQQSEISRIEGARGNPTVATLSVLARALGGVLSIRAAPAASHGRTPSGGRRRVKRSAAARLVRTPAVRRGSS